MATRYWVGGEGNWSDNTNHWSASSGGSAGASLPTSSDDVIIDSNSGLGGGTLMFDISYPGAKCKNFTSILGSAYTINSSNYNTLNIYGNGIFESGITFLPTGASAFYVRFQQVGGIATIQSNGVQFEAIGFFTEATWRLLDNLKCSLFFVSHGTFDANDFDVTFQNASYYFYDTPGSVYMGNGTWECIHNNARNLTGLNIYSSSGNLTLFPEGSTFKINCPNDTYERNFQFGGFTFNNIWVTGSGNLYFLSSVTCNVFTVDTPPRTIKFEAGMTLVVAVFTVSGTPGNLITLNSSVNGSQYILSKSSGMVSADYLSIKDSIATGGASWYAGVNSTDEGGNTGWIFTGPTATSHYLKITNLGFDLPSDATILGIVVEIELKQSGALGAKDSAVRIIKGGVIGSTDRSNPIEYPTTETRRSYGSSTDLWGETWTVANIEASNFGVALSCQSPGGQVTTISVDHIRVTVHYSTDNVVAIAAEWNLFQWG